MAQITWFKRPNGSMFKSEEDVYGDATLATAEEIAAEEARAQNESRKSEILDRLDEIDSLSIRALRAKGIGRGNPQDDTSLTALEDEAELLRIELATLA